MEIENDYQLIGDPGLKNGEKKLRSHLIMTKEWSSDEFRKNLVRNADLSCMTFWMSCESH